MESLLDFIREDDPTFFAQIRAAQDRFILDGGDDESGALLALVTRGWRDVHRSADEYLDEMIAGIVKAFDEGKSALNRDALIAQLANRNEREVFTLVSGAISVQANGLRSTFETVLAKVVEASGTRAVRRLKRTLRDLRRVAAEKTFEEIIQEFGFDVTNPKAVEWIREHAAELVTDVSEVTRERIKELIETSFVEGVDVRDLADQIADEIGDAERAETIARTETMTASNAGQVEAWDQAIEEGLLTGNEKKEWIVTPDDRLCPICEPMDGVQVGLFEDFDLEGERVDQPPAHPRCRCTIALAVV